MIRHKNDNDFSILGLDNRRFLCLLKLLKENGA